MRWPDEPAPYQTAREEMGDCEEARPETSRAPVGNFRASRKARGSSPCAARGRRSSLRSREFSGFDARRAHSPTRTGPLEPGAEGLARLPPEHRRRLTSPAAALKSLRVEASGRQSEMPSLPVSHTDGQSEMPSLPVSHTDGQSEMPSLPVSHTDGQSEMPSLPVSHTDGRRETRHRIGRDGLPKI